MKAELVEVPFHCPIVFLLLMRTSFHLVLFLFLNWIPLLVVIGWQWWRNESESSPRPTLPAGTETSQCGWDSSALHSSSQNCLSGLCLLRDSDRERDTPKDESLRDTLQTGGCVLTNFYFHLLTSFSGISVYHLLSDFCVVPLGHRPFPRSDPRWMDSMVTTSQHEALGSKTMRFSLPLPVPECGKRCGRS